MAELSEYWKDVSPILKQQATEKREKEFEPRLKYAMEQFEKENIPYKICNESIGHFNLLKNDKTIVSFWSYTGAVYTSLKETNRENIRGIKHCIKLYKQLVKTL